MNKAFEKDMPLLIDGLKTVHKKYRKLFSMRAFSSTGRPPRMRNDCKTTACAIGWLTVFAPNSALKFVIKRGGLTPTFKQYSNFEAIQKAYDLSGSETSYLFGVPNYDPSPLQVAHRIESVLYDGFPTDLNNSYYI